MRMHLWASLLLLLVATPLTAAQLDDTFYDENPWNNYPYGVHNAQYTESRGNEDADDVGVNAGPSVAPVGSRFEDEGLTRAYDRDMYFRDVYPVLEQYDQDISPYVFFETAVGGSDEGYQDRNLVVEGTRYYVPDDLDFTIEARVDDDFVMFDCDTEGWQDTAGGCYWRSNQDKDDFRRLRGDILQGEGSVSLDEGWHDLRFAWRDDENDDHMDMVLLDSDGNPTPYTELFHAVNYEDELPRIVADEGQNGGAYCRDGIDNDGNFQDGFADTFNRGFYTNKVTDQSRFIGIEDDARSEYRIGTQRDDMPDFGERGVDCYDRACDGQQGPTITVKEGPFAGQALTGACNFRPGDDRPTEYDCADGYDNDFDGLIDYQDPDCGAPANVDPEVYYYLHDQDLYDASQPETSAVCSPEIIQTGGTCTGETFTCESFDGTGMCPETCTSIGQTTIPATGGTCPTGYSLQERTQEAPVEEEDNTGPGEDRERRIDDGGFTVQYCVPSTTCATPRGSSQSFECENQDAATCNLIPSCDYSAETEETTSLLGVTDPTDKYLCADSTENGELSTPGNAYAFLNASENDGKIVSTVETSHVSTDQSWTTCAPGNNTTRIPAGGDYEFSCQTLNGAGTIRECCSGNQCYNEDNPLQTYPDYLGGAYVGLGENHQALRFFNEQGSIVESKPVTLGTARDNDVLTTTTAGIQINETKLNGTDLHVYFQLSGEQRLNYEASQVLVNQEAFNISNLTDNDAANTTLHVAIPTNEIPGDTVDTIGLSAVLPETLTSQNGVTITITKAYQSDTEGPICGDMWTANFEGENNQPAPTSPGVSACRAALGENAWTGTLCCGDDTYGNTSEVYTDDARSCWDGHPATQNAPLSESTGVEEDNYILPRAQEFSVCAQETTRNQNIGNGAQNTITEQYTTFQELTGYICQPNLGWTETIDGNALYDLSQLALETVTPAADFSLACGGLQDVAPRSDSALPSCTLREGANTVEPEQLLILIQGSRDETISTLQQTEWFQNNEQEVPGSCDNIDENNADIQHCKTFTQFTSGNDLSAEDGRVHLYHSPQQNITALALNPETSDGFTGTAWTLQYNPFTEFLADTGRFVQGLFTTPLNFDNPGNLKGVSLTALGDREVTGTLFAESQGGPLTLRATYSLPNTNRDDLQAYLQTRFPQSADRVDVEEIESNTYNATLQLDQTEQILTAWRTVTTLKP